MVKINQREPTEYNKKQLFLFKYNARTRSMKAMNPAILSVVCLFLISCAPSSANKMVDNFNKNKSTFNRLVYMLKTDKGISYNIENGNKPFDCKKYSKITKERLSEYKELLEKIGCYEISGTGDHISIIYKYFGYFWEYRYSVIKPKHIVKDLDNFIKKEHSKNNKVYGYCQHIEGNWYVMYAD